MMIVTETSKESSEIASGSRSREKLMEEVRATRRAAEYLASRAKGEHYSFLKESSSLYFVPEETPPIS